ncbi:transcription termination factor MTEF18, mitochondrial-like [Telopea speciosissima]|uniref:transcription termination factor MTEF18, mitochondrial-like n=1 Tax=Telopea speciosissima TaxID=54955 RepID=UPI001CC3FE66|nr:transcription termination factor MTEF18, mitochondrial-like [Telopea speciosissima]
MRFVPVSSVSLCCFISRHFSSSLALSKFPKLRKVPYRYRARAVEQAQQALTEYLHSTRSFSFTLAEHISKNSVVSLSDLISKVEFSTSNFFRNFQKFLRYHPIDEIEFFFESIGIPPTEINGFLSRNELFLSEDGNILKVAHVLSAFGFPWNVLGKLYKEEIFSKFGETPDALTARLKGFREFGFDSVAVAGICLAFPFVLGGDDELVGRIDALFDDLNMVFLKFGLASHVEWNVYSWCEICSKIRVFYVLGCEMGKMGVLFGKGQNVFLQYSEEFLVQKVEFFCRFGVNKVDVALLLLKNPNILNYDLESPLISVLGFLKHIGLSKEQVNSVVREYPYVLGRNKLGNLPHLMRAVDLHHWFFNKIMNGEHQLLTDSVISNPGEDLDIEFKHQLDRIQSAWNHKYRIGKLDFLLEIGFGENVSTMKVLSLLHGSRVELQERFDCLLQLGIEFCKLCKMVRLKPGILNQNPDMLEQKVNFLCKDAGSSVQYLDVFPAYLCFHLENRIKPRVRFYMWLTEKGVAERDYSIASIVATSEKNFLARLHKIHPAAPKYFLECFSSKRPSDSDQGDIGYATPD